MAFLGLFGKGKNSAGADKNSAQKKISESIAQLDKVAGSLGNMEASVGPGVRSCIDELSWCRKELGMMLGMRDKAAEAEFYRRVLAQLDEIADTVKKMKYFYTYIDSKILPDIIALRQLIDETGKNVN